MALSERELELCGRLKLTPTVAESWRKTFPLPSDLRISSTAVGSANPKNLTEGDYASGQTISPKLTSSAEDSPAKTSAMPESEQESTESVADSGLNMRESFASYDPASSSWRTSQLCLGGEWSEYSETWPRAGMTRNGKAFELPMLVRRTEENEPGLLPTPVGPKSGSNRSSYPGAPYRPALSQIALMWPTPNVPNGGRSPKDGMSLTGMTPDGKKRQVGLENAVKMWPTPDANTSTYSNGYNGFMNLREAVRMWPTPTTGAAFCKWGGSGSREKCKTILTPEEINGALNPTWVEWLMGYPLGWTALEDSETPSSRKSRSSSAKE